MKFATLVVATLIASSLTAVAQVPVISSIGSQATNAPPVSPGMPILVIGSNLAVAVETCSGPATPLKCGSVSATVNGRAVPVRFVAPTQIVTYIPVDQPVGDATVIVTNHLGQNSAPFKVQVEQYAPGIHRLIDSSGTMLGFFSDASQQSISRSNPAVPGREIILYAVGLGPTNPIVPTGQVGSGAVITMPVLSVGGRLMNPGAAGLGCGTICDPGTYLVRFILPPDTGAGDVPVTIEIAGKRSPPMTLIVGATSGGPAVGYLQSSIDARVRRMAPGMIANVVGGGFAPLPSAFVPCTIDISYWPTKCQGVTVSINGHDAAIQSVTSNYVTIQIPFEVAPGVATLVVQRESGKETLKSTPFPFTLEPYSPTLQANPQSPYAGVVIQNSGGFASPGNPLIPGDTVTIFADGLGQTNPPMVTGFPLLQPSPTVAKPSVTVRGKALENIQSLVFPGPIGQYRVTATVPAGLPTGDLPIILEIGGKKSQDGLLVPVSNQPVIAAVTNAASNTPAIVSGSWVSIYGRNLSATRRSWTEQDFTYDWLPTSLDGVEVYMNDTPATVSFVSANQLNVLAPNNLPTGPVEVSVRGPLGNQKATALVKSYAPGLFPLGVPPGNILLALHSDWSYVARPGQLPPNLTARPAKPRETIVFYGTGFGPTDPFVTMYYRFSGSALLKDAPPVKVQIGPATAEVVYVGLVANGLYQLNVVVPDLPDGDHEVIVSMGAESSPPSRYIPVQR